MLEVLADELERMSDPRLELVTLTGVDVTRDLAYATVYYSTLAATAADRAGVVGRAGGRRASRAAPHLRGLVGRQMRIRQVPKLTFEPDPGIIAGQRIEEILRGIHHDAAPQDEAVGRRGGVRERRTTTTDNSTPRLTRAASVIAGASRVTLVCHVSPDGDALGSTLALHHVLRAAGMDSRRLVPAAVRGRAALPRSARPRAAHAARARRPTSPRS